MVNQPASHVCRGRQAKTRRGANEQTGDALDFWRVETFVPDHELRKCVTIATAPAQSHATPLLHEGEYIAVQVGTAAHRVRDRLS